MVQSKTGARSRGIVAKVYKEEGLELKYESDDYGDDLPHWMAYPGGEKNEGLLIIPYAYVSGFQPSSSSLFQALHF